jgi:beta-lactamase superfamily II metal-dependent hydrolase
MGEAGAVSRLGPVAPLVPQPDDFVVYVLNVGDGDAIVLQFPVGPDGTRPIGVVDAFDGDKVVRFTRDVLGATGLRFVVTTHPHWDHIRGVPELFDAYPGTIAELWDSGFRYASNRHREIIERVTSLEAQGRTRFLRPTSGFEVEVVGVRITVLSPSIALRNRYDTYGVDVNNASIVLRLEYPITPVALDYPRVDDDDHIVPEAPPATRTRSIILGGDAQTDAWSRVVEEFPHLVGDDKAWARQIGARTGRQPLACDVLKISHHFSKNGINLELVERMGDSPSGSGASIGPTWIVGSCSTGGSSTHGFPHGVTQEIVREVREPLVKKRRNDPTLAHATDEELGILYTASTIAGPGDEPAGSIAIVFGGDGSAPTVHRLLDSRSADATLDRTRRHARPIV